MTGVGADPTGSTAAKRRDVLMRSSFFSPACSGQSAREEQPTCRRADRAWVLARTGKVRGGNGLAQRVDASRGRPSSPNEGPSGQKTFGTRDRWPASRKQSEGGSPAPARVWL